MSREDLEKALRDRDAVIIDLVNRVRELERRVPPAEEQRRAAEATTPPAPAPATPGPTAPARPAPAPTAAPGGQPSGRPSAPGQLSVDPDAAERALDRTLVETGVVLLEAGQIEVTPSFRYSRSDQSVPGSVFGDQVSEVLFKQNTLTFQTDIDVGLPFDSQLELSLPFTYIDRSVAEISQNNQDAVAFSGLEVGLAKTLLRERGWIPDIVARASWHTPTGEQEKDGVFFGDGFNQFTAGVTASKSLDPAVFAVGLSRQWTLEKDDIKPGAQTTLTFGTFLAVSPEVSLRFVFDQTFVEDSEFDGERLEGSDTVLASLELGGSVLLGARTLLDLSAEIGVTDDTPDFTVRLALPIRFDLPLR